MPAASAPILVIDDDEQIRAALRDTLELEGYAVVDVESGPAALEFLQANPRPLLILVDWNMVPMNAPAFMKELETLPSCEVPVVLITADGHAQQKSRMSNFVGYLKKPVDLNALFALVDRFASR
jgi:CheY-like chemotaxis protein